MKDLVRLERPVAPEATAAARAKAAISHLYTPWPPPLEDISLEEFRRLYSEGGEDE